MKSTLRKLAVTAVVAAMFTNGVAQAACTQSNLTGLWKAYSAGVDEGVSYWTSCFLQISSTGAITPTTCVNSFGLRGALTNARIVLAVGSQCAYNGTFTFAGERNTLMNMTMARDKYSGYGVGVFPGGSFIFSMVKI
jgi:hypothetical protein